MLLQDDSELSKLFARAVKAGYKEDFKTWTDGRRRCQTDLFYLAKDILGYDLVDNYYCPEHMTMAPEPGTCSVCGQEFKPYPTIPIDGRIESPHRLICDFFVHKNPDKSIAAQDTMKNRLLMMPRGSFKSSCDEADTVQWIICFPNIRIALLTAVEDLALGFIKKVKSFFILAGEKKGKEFIPRPTRFQLFFPEHCLLDVDKGPVETFITPARTKENIAGTLDAVSLKGESSGWHYDVGKYDDCVSNINSGPTATQENRVKVRQSIDLVRSLIDPYGYHDNIGTPYDENDAYAHQIEHSDDTSLRILRRSAWELKEGSKKTKKEDLCELDYYLLFPFDATGTVRLTYAFLKEKQRTDPHIFACQYLCKPSAARQVKFSEQLLNSHITQAEGLPQDDRFSISTWDLAYSVGKGRDFSVGTVGRFDLAQQRAFVVHMIRGRFGKADLVFQIANQAKTWKVSRIRIENSPGANFLENDIHRELIRIGYDCSLEFFPVDSQKGAKEVRAELVELALLNDRLWFSSEVSILTQVFNEFLNFKPSGTRHDDCVDSIAHLLMAMPAAPEVPVTEKQKQEAVWSLLAEKQLHEMVFGLKEKVPESEPSFIPPTTWEGAPVFRNPEEQIYGI